MMKFESFEEYCERYNQAEESYAEYEIAELSKDDYNPMDFEEWLEQNNIKL